MSAPRVRLAATLVGALLAPVALSGCGPSTDPVRWPADPDTGTPAIDWPVGAPDTSDEWVAGLLDAQIALAVAKNAHDYSSPHLADLVDPEHLAARARHAAGNASRNLTDEGAGPYWYLPGPPPMRIRDVSVEGGLATIETCEPSDWVTYDYEPVTVEHVLDDERGSTWIYHLRRAADGRIVLVDANAPARGCELDAPRPGYFDPAPPFGEHVWYTDVIGPDGHPVEEPRE